jgi:ParB-like chromosome segregation protein Spo0J
MKIESVPIEKIGLTKRYREDAGDLEALAQNIRELGLLQPIGLNRYYELVFGQRRLDACRFILEWEEIPAHILDFDSILLGEYAENEFRKGFTRSERVAIAKAVEEELGKRQGQRTDQLVGNSPQVPKGQKTRDIAAKRAGFSSTDQYRSAEKVVALGSPELVAAMDAEDISTSAAETIARAVPKEKQAEVLRLPKKRQRAVVQDARQKLRDETELHFFEIRRKLHDLARTVFAADMFWELAAQFTVRDLWEDIDRSINFLIALKEGHPNATKRPQRLPRTH